MTKTLRSCWGEDMPRLVYASATKKLEGGDRLSFGGARPLKVKVVVDAEAVDRITESLPTESSRLDAWRRKTTSSSFTSAASRVHRHDFLRRLLTERLAVPTRLQMNIGGLDPTESWQLHPTKKDSVETAAFDSTISDVLESFEFVIDPRKQHARYLGFGPEIEREVPSLFPIQSRSRLAHLACERTRIFGPNATYTPGMFRYQMDVSLELKLSLFSPARNDDEMRGPLLDVRHEKLVFSHFDIPTPNGAFIWRGEERSLPADEYIDEFLRSLRTFARHIREAMNDRTDWGKHVTPKTLVDPES